MVAPQKYRSVFTGQEIDEAVAGMKASLSANLITNDFTGGIGRVASAELAKILKADIDANNEGSSIKTQLMSIPNAKVLSDAEYARLLSLYPTSAFRGSYPDAASRNAALAAESSGFTGNEISFIADDGSSENLPEFSKWDSVSASWKKVQLYNSAVGTIPQVVAVAGNLNLFNFNAARFNTAKCLIVVSSSDGTQKQVLESLITHINGSTYISTYNEMGNATLFDIVSQYNIDTTPPSVNIVVQTLSANLTVAGKLIALI